MLRYIAVFLALLTGVFTSIEWERRTDDPDKVGGGVSFEASGTFKPEGRTPDVPAVAALDIDLLPAAPLVIREQDVLRLLALFQTEDQHAASAVILVEGQGAYRYWAGDLIGEDYYLGAILPDRVLLVHGENSETLYMHTGSSVEAVFPDQKEPVVEDVQTEEEEAVADMGRRASMLAYLDVRPVTEGQANGYVIGEGFPKETMEKTGVAPGDIVVSVNGYAVGEEVSDTLAWNSVRASDTATIVIRGKEGEFMVYYP